MNTNNSPAARASSNNKVMRLIQREGPMRRLARWCREWKARMVPQKAVTAGPDAGTESGAASWFPGRHHATRRGAGWTATAALAALLGACAVAPPPPSSAPPSPPIQPLPPAPDDGPLPPPIVRDKSLWTAVSWSSLPGWGADDLADAWNAWLRSCERPQPVFAGVCGELRLMSLATVADKQAWVMRRFVPYRITERDGAVPQGLLTGYYEPILDARTRRDAAHPWPLYRPPATLRAGQPWFSRQDIDTHPQARAALAGREIAWLADPIDVLLLHIQGSGRLRLRADDGSVRTVRVAFAGTNNHPYRSVNTWLARQGVPVAPWPDATRAWVRQNPQRVQEMLWTNPRYVFFREEPLSELEARFGPRGAQGVALTPGRSIAVDPQSIPYGTPVWLSTQGVSLETQRLVLAQDTGSAIVGAVRADYFAGWGDEALALAAGIRQPLQLWALWPR